jgi:hypothetical protein
VFGGQGRSWRWSAAAGERQQRVSSAQRRLHRVWARQAAANDTI